MFLCLAPTKLSSLLGRVGVPVVPGSLCLPRNVFIGIMEEAQIDVWFCCTKVFGFMNYIWVYKRQIKGHFLSSLLRTLSGHPWVQSIPVWLLCHSVFPSDICLLLLLQETFMPILVVFWQGLHLLKCSDPALRGVQFK